MENRRAEQGSGGLVSVGGEKDVKRWCGTVNMVQILCAHVCKWKKMRPVDTIPGMEGGEFKYDML
jgi:hypothetical protein